MAYCKAKLKKKCRKNTVTSVHVSALDFVFYSTLHSIESRFQKLRLYSQIKLNSQY